MSITTSNHYLTAVKGFCNWLLKDGRTDRNPVVHLSQINNQTDIRRKRRHLTAEDFSKLIETARVGKTVCGLAGPDRAMLYVTAA